MSISGMPARSAIAVPSPVLMWALDVVRYTCPQPRSPSTVAFGLDQQWFTGLDLHDQCAEDRAFVIADQVYREILIEEMGAGTHVLLIQRMQNRMSGAVGRGAGTSGLCPPKFWL